MGSVKYDCALRDKNGGHSWTPIDWNHAIPNSPNVAFRMKWVTTVWTAWTSAAARLCGSSFLFAALQSVSWRSGALGYFWRTVASLLSVCAFAKSSHVKTPVLKLCFSRPPTMFHLTSFLLMQWFVSLCIPYLLVVMPKVCDHLGGVSGCSFLLTQNAPKAVTWSQTGWLPCGESWEK